MLSRETGHEDYCKHIYDIYFRVAAVDKINNEVEGDATRKYNLMTEVCKLIEALNKKYPLDNDTQEDKNQNSDNI
jgi:hypothetical protein